MQGEMQNEARIPLRWLLSTIFKTRRPRTTPTTLLDIPRLGEAMKPFSICSNCGSPAKVDLKEYCVHCKKAYEEGLNHGYDCGWEDAMKEARQ